MMAAEKKDFGLFLVPRDIVADFEGVDVSFLEACADRVDPGQVRISGLEAFEVGFELFISMVFAVDAAQERKLRMVQGGKLISLEKIGDGGLVEACEVLRPGQGIDAALPFKEKVELKLPEGLSEVSPIYGKERVARRQPPQGIRRGCWVRKPVED
jgi:hypothetical protein